MVRYRVTLTEEEKQELEELVQKGGKGYRIKHAQILLKLDDRPENKDWTYDRISDAYRASSATISGVARRFVHDGLEAALGRKKQENRYRKITGAVEAKICMIACSTPPEGKSRWTMQMLADELVRLEGRLCCCGRVICSGCSGGVLGALGQEIPEDLPVLAGELGQSQHLFQVSPGGPAADLHHQYY